MQRSSPTPFTNILPSFRSLCISSFCTFPPSYVLAVILYLLLPLPSPDSLRVLQWNAGGLRARSNALLHFISLYLVELICIQEFNLDSSFRILEYSALQSDCTRSRSGMFSPDDLHASGDVIIFVRQGLFFFEFFTFSLSSPDSYSDYVGVNIILNYSSSLSFLNVYATSIDPLRKIGEPALCLCALFPPPEVSSFWENSIAITPSGTQKVPLTRREQVFERIISSALLSHNDLDTPTLLHRS